jgi:uncharacterized membrane protein YgaE (UPF0421/DUF939 family)
MNSIDRLLAQIEAEYQELAEPEQLKQQKLPDESCQQPLSKNEASLASLLSELEPETKHPNKQSRAKQETSINSLLNGLKADYEAQARVEEQLRQEQLKAEKLRKQQLKLQELEALKQQAIAWLKELDPLSTEGLWFENFAEKYSSKLEAALDYLQEFQGNNP